MSVSQCAATIEGIYKFIWCAAPLSVTRSRISLSASLSLKTVIHRVRVVKKEKRKPLSGNTPRLLLAETERCRENWD
jgi:hypothetical protein